jgi:phosphate transport system permease protein
MLSVGRIISETAVFYVTLGGSYRLPKSLLSGGRTPPLHLFYLAMDTNAFEKAMGTGAVLIVSIVIINLVIDLISRKLSAGVRQQQ